MNIKESSYISWYHKNVDYKFIVLTCCNRVLKKNQLNGSLVIGTTHSKQLKLIDLQYNVISQLDVKEEYNVTMM